MVGKIRKTPIKEESIVKKAIKKNKQEKDTKDIHKLNKNQTFVKFETYLPPEEQEKIDEEYERANDYISIKERKIRKLFNDKKSNLRRLADFLYIKLYEFPMVDKKEVSKKLKMSVGSMAINISKLNFYSQYPLTIIPVYRKKDFIQAITKNEEDAGDWERRKFRTIASMDKTREKGVFIMGKLGERLAEKKQRIKVSVSHKKKR